MAPIVFLLLAAFLIDRPIGHLWDFGALDFEFQSTRKYKLGKIYFVTSEFRLLRKNRFLPKKSDFWQKFQFSTNISIFDKHFSFTQKFQFSTKISIFDKHFKFRQKFQFSTKFGFSTKFFNVLQKFQFSTKIF